MLRAILFAPILLAVALATSAQAQGARPPVCKDRGYANAKEISFATADKVTLAGLRIGLNVDSVANSEHGPGQLCLRGFVQIGSDSYLYIGSNKTTPPRVFSKAHDRSELFILSAIPKPEAAEYWERTTHEGSWPNFSNDQLMYVFEMVTRKGRSVYRFFDRIPTDAKILQLMCDAKAGLLKPVAVTGPYPERSKPLLVAPSIAPVGHAACHAKLMTQ